MAGRGHWFWLPLLGAALTFVSVKPAAAGAAERSEPVKVGLVLSYTGPYARLGQEITRGMELYLEKVGYRAGGRTIQLIKEDEEADPAVAVRKARKLVEADRVDILAGVILTPSAYGIRDYIHERKIPTIISNAAANGITRGKTKSPYLFRVSVSAWQPAYPFGRWVAENVSRRVMLVALDYGFGRETLDAFKETFLPAGGQVIDEVYTPLGTTDYSSIMARISGRRPEAVFAVLSGSDAVIFLRQFAQFGLNRTVRLAVSGETVDENVLESVGTAALGALSVDQWVYTLDHPANQTFVREYRQRYQGLPNHFAVRGYDTAQVIVHALNAVRGDLSNLEGFIRAIETMRFESPRGIIEFDPSTHQVIENIYVREVVQLPEGVVNRLVTSLGRIRDRDT